MSGLNHILPTDKGAKSQGGLGLEAYYKAQSIQEFTELGLSEMGKAGVELALTEGCVSHAESLLCRLK